MAREIKKGMLVMVVGLPSDIPAMLPHLGHVGEVLCNGAEYIAMHNLDPDKAGHLFNSGWVVDGARSGPEMPVMGWPVSCLMPIEPPAEAWYETTKHVNCRCTVQPLD